MKCRDLVELVTAYLEEALDDSTRARVERHLRKCDGCTTYVDQVRTTVTSLAAIEDELDPAFRARLLDAFEGWAS